MLVSPWKEEKTKHRTDHFKGCEAVYRETCSGESCNVRLQRSVTSSLCCSNKAMNLNKVKVYTHTTMYTHTNEFSKRHSYIKTIYNMDAKQIFTRVLNNSEF